MDKTITIIPRAGLCNRLRAMISGINVAKKWGAKCVILLNKSSECYCKFSDLFETPNLSNVSIVENRNPIYFLGRKRNLYLPNLIQKMLYDFRLYDFTGESDIFDIIPQKAKKILISSYSQMYDLKGINRNEAILIPKKMIQNRIDDITKNFGKHAVGIHIRGTDNVKSLRHSPFDVFVDCINKELIKNPDAIFYISTDEMEYKERMVQIFGDKIITSPVILKRDSVEGMKGALVDLYCLSQTNYIIGSYWSSFSEIAAEIGGIELIVANKDNKESGI